MGNNWTIDPALGATEGRVSVDGLATWYAVVGDETSERDAGKAPLLLLHGGPGGGHDYLESMAALSATGRRVVFYDQQGCGNSDQPIDPERWTIDFYLREIGAIRVALGLERCHILGQSWGGMLLMEYLVTRPQGVISAVLASSPASMPMWIEETGRQRAALPAHVIATLERHEAAGTWDSPEYEAAVTVFYEHHLCRVPHPEFVTRSFAKLARNPHVYRTMNGPTEFHVVGTLKGWEVLSRLKVVDEPILLTSGRNDEATPAQVAAIAARLPQAEWVLFEASSHFAHVEEPERYMGVVADFLARAEAGRVRCRTDAPDPTEARDGGDPTRLARSAGMGRLAGPAGSV